MHEILLYLAHTRNPFLSEEADEIIHWLANREWQRRKESPNVI